MPENAPGGPPPIARLIVNADDFGVSEPVNDGIALAHRQGILTAASLMAVGRAFVSAVRWCRALPALDIGVHLSLVAERPLIQGSALAGANGRFPTGARALVQRFAAGRVCLADVEAEWSAQIERILGQGLCISHLDSHQHVHALPRLAELTQRLADRYRIPFLRRPLERRQPDRPIDGRGLLRMLGQGALEASWAAARLAGAGRAARRPLHFLGFQAGGRLTETRLRQLLSSLRPGRDYELMCHPGFRPPEPDLRRWGYRHEEELRALTSPLIRAQVAGQGIRLATFQDLMKR